MLTHFVSLVWCEHLNQGGKKKMNFQVVWTDRVVGWPGMCWWDSGPQVLMQVNSACNHLYYQGFKIYANDFVTVLNLCVSVSNRN